MAPLELAENRRNRIRQRSHAVEFGDMLAGSRVLDYQTQGSSSEHADQERARDLLHHENAGKHEANQGEQRRTGSDVTQSHGGSIVRHDDAGILKANEGDEQANSATDGLLQ